MTHPAPPRFLQAALLSLLAPRHREAIAGDLLEAHTEMAIRSGPRRADLWYARQVLSLVPQSLSASERMLAGLSAFALLYGSWFGVMELLLRHPGYLRREWIAGTILGQAALTLFFLVVPGIPGLRYVVAAGCLPVLFLVSLAVRGLSRGAAIEGYVLLMALSLAAQALCTAIVLASRARDERRLSSR